MREGAAQQAGAVRMENRLEGAEARRRALLDRTRTLLLATPKELSPLWLYDERGSLLFEEITGLPEYYPTLCEREILEHRAREIAQLTGADVLVELGAGSSNKTRVLLDALSAAGTLRLFAPLDVSEPMLLNTARKVAAEYPGLSVHAIVGELERDIRDLPVGQRTLMAFLGGTIGNFKPEGRGRLLRDVARSLRPGDFFLLGTDLVKERRVLELAYDDPRGVTAAFNLNVLEVLNRELQADFDPAAFAHRARFDEERSWIEMLLVARSAQRVSVPALSLSLDFSEGEALRTEVSTKFRREGVERELTEAGLQLLRFWTDSGGRFGLSLSARRAP